MKKVPVREVERTEPAKIGAPGRGRVPVVHDAIQLHRLAVFEAVRRTDKRRERKDSSVGVLVRGVGAVRDSRRFPPFFPARSTSGWRRRS